jgi:glycosyltransferase involved in cell wall biosynthesis
MRILHTIHSMSFESGGPAEVVRKLAETAQRSGAYETEVVTLDSPQRPLAVSGEFPIHAVGPGAGKYGYTRNLDGWLRANLSRFDGVIVNGLWQYHGWASWKACRGKLPYLICAHGMLDPWFKRAFPLKHLKKLLYWKAIERRVLRDAGAVLFTSPIEAELAPLTFPASEWKSFIIPYGTLEPEGDRQLQMPRFYEACPQVRGKKFLLFLGRIHEKKGCDLLIEAFARQASTDPDIHLVIAGPDEQGKKPELMALASRNGAGGRVHFPGMLQGDAKWGAFHAAEVFALPSHQENFGVAVAESLACGTPVLLSNQVNIWREILADGVGLVEDDTLEGTTRLLERWRGMSDAEKQGMAARCVPSFRARYDMNRVPDVIRGLFEKRLHGEPIAPPRQAR